MSPRAQLADISLPLSVSMPVFDGDLKPYLLTRQSSSLNWYHSCKEAQT